jgi:hypothetical protein
VYEKKLLCGRALAERKYGEAKAPLVTVCLYQRFAASLSFPPGVDIPGAAIVEP